MSPAICEHQAEIVTPFHQGPCITIGRLANFFWAKKVPTEVSSKVSGKVIMTEPSTQPTLTPQFCFSTIALKDFLKISRGAIDDSINQNLNALITPAKDGFDPNSTSQRDSRTTSRLINPGLCVKFKDKVLFPSWQTRTDVLNYCASVAASPDLDDPESILRRVESERERERVVDDRLDPYSSRFFPREARTERLAALIRQELQVEKIIRTRTWDLVAESCGEVIDDWEVALNNWRKGSKPRES